MSRDLVLRVSASRMGSARPLLPPQVDLSEVQVSLLHPCQE